jgi:hypothetical protein
MKTPLTSLIATAALALCASAAHANNLVVQGDTVFDRDTSFGVRSCIDTYSLSKKPERNHAMAYV